MSPAGKYTAEHSDALSDIMENGAPMTFAFTELGTFDELTGTWVGGGTTTVSGHALGVKGDPLVYEKLNLIESEAPTVLFAPLVYGERPRLNSTTEWGGKAFTVKSVLPFAPDATAIFSRVVVG